MYKWANKQLKTTRHYKVGRYNVLCVEPYSGRSFRLTIGHTYCFPITMPSLNMEKFAKSLACIKLTNQDYWAEINYNDYRRTVRPVSLDTLYQECLLLSQPEVL